MAIPIKFNVKKVLKNANFHSKVRATSKKYSLSQLMYIREDNILREGMDYTMRNKITDKRKEGRKKRGKSRREVI